MIKHLYDSFASRWYRGGSIWFYSDPHFGDTEMQQVRKGYISDEEQIKRINSKVGRNDTLIILGDIGDINWVSKLRGYKVLIMGNHDKGASNYQAVFDEVYEGVLIISPKLILSHEPIMDLPSFLYNIHGHDHSNWFVGGNHFNMCAEHNDYYPVNLNQIIKAGCLTEVESIHRLTIDNAIVRKQKKG